MDSLYSLVRSIEEAENEFATQVLAELEFQRVLLQNVGNPINRKIYLRCKYKIHNSNDCMVRWNKKSLNLNIEFQRRYEHLLVVGSKKDSATIMCTPLPYLYSVMLKEAMKMHDHVDFLQTAAVFPFEPQDDTISSYLSLLDDSKLIFKHQIADRYTKYLRMVGQ